MPIDPLTVTNLPCRPSGKANMILRYQYESGTPVSKDYTVETSRFNGKLNWVQIDLGEDDHGHMIDPEHVIHIAMSWQ
jgi:hypothetical protein